MEAATKKITVIPVTKERFTERKFNEEKKKRVAAYARVSTDLEEQVTSYKAQIDYYKNYIAKKENWEYVNVYADEGISGTHKERRPMFNQMIADAKDGKIDLILTKSISRFARNTVDTLTTVRELKAAGVEVYFEKENISTFDSKGEVLLTILSSLAQDESRSISENISWGYRKRFADGKVLISYGIMIGYKKGADGNPEIVEEEAETIRWIYNKFLLGYSTTWIAKELTRLGVPTPCNGKEWHPRAIESILTNEKYTGDAILQKTYKPDLLSPRKINEGELPKYYVENSHPAIISKDVFKEAQLVMATKSSNCKMFNVSPFSSRVVCGDCGNIFTRITIHSTDKYKHRAWKCLGRDRKKTKCKTPTLSEEHLENAFLSAINKVMTNKEKVIKTAKELQNLLCNTDELKAQKSKLETDMVVTGKLIDENISKGPQSVGSARNSEYMALSARLESESNQLKEINSQITLKDAKRYRINKFIKSLEERDELYKEFNGEDFIRLVDHMTVYGLNNIVVTFKGGIEQKA